MNNLSTNTLANSNRQPALPEFPDSDVPIAPLLRLSLDKLANHDESESTRFFRASAELGFFYLDLQGTETGESILRDADALFDVGERFFELSLEEKAQYDFSAQKSYYGYKAQGAAVADRSGNLDRNEFYNVRIARTTSCGIKLTVPTGLQERHRRHRRPLTGAQGYDGQPTTT